MLYMRFWKRFIKRGDSFSSYHPAVNFIFYGLVLTVSMFFMHPVLMAISGISALIYTVYLKGKRSLFSVFALALPAFLLSAVINPLFTHEGITVLFYFKSGNPVTLESLIYGFAAGAMMAVVILWFSSLNEVMTSDKFVYLFGKLLPAVSLLLSMVFRFVPRFSAQIERVSSAQKCIGRDVTNGNSVEKLKHGVRILSIMITWSLENSVETADSMKARGYGLRGRTSFNIYRFCKRDAVACAVMVISFIWIVIGIITGEMSIMYYPVCKVNSSSFYSVTGYIIYAIFCLLPMILNVWEDIKWHCLTSKI